MSKYQVCIKQPLQPLRHPKTPSPSRVSPSKPPLQLTSRMILRNVELIGGPDERPVFLKVDLHD